MTASAQFVLLAIGTACHDSAGGVSACESNGRCRAEWIDFVNIRNIIKLV